MRTRPFSPFSSIKEFIRYLGYRLVLIVGVGAFLFYNTGQAKAAESYTIKAPRVLFTGDTLKIELLPPKGTVIPEDTSIPRVFIGGMECKVVRAEKIYKAHTPMREFIVATIDVHIAGKSVAQSSLAVIPGWLSIVPALVAILFALMLRQVLVALFIGVWMGAWISYGLSISGIWYGVLDLLQIHILNSLAPPDGSTAHMSIILFTLMIGGTIGIISRNGGTRGIVNRLTGWASSPVRGQTVAGILGLLVFFDDYANTLVVGNTMRPITDRLRISREKLAYIVDSTAAPVSCIALITTWIGFQVGLIDEALTSIGGINDSAYAFFLNMLPYSFYPVLALVFVFMISLSGRDFGPMYQAEIRARKEGALFREGASVSDNSTEGREMEAVADKPHRAINAIVPILVLVIGTIIGLLVTGEGDSLREVIGSADSYKAILWASLAAVLVAIVLTVLQGILSLNETLEAWINGMKSMLFAVLVLVLAWALSAVNTELHTADYLVSLLGDSLHPALISVVVFVLAALTAFATGTSWGTMSILIPLVVPISWAVLQNEGIADESGFYIMYLAVACVLAGAVWGDHCSPISDTTILSSMATSCDHVDHVLTQMPYALLVGGVSLIVCVLPVGFGLPWWLGIVTGVATLWLALRTIGRPVEPVSAIKA